MNFELDETTALIVRTAGEFARREVAPLVSQAEREGVFPDAVLDRAGEVGLLALAGEGEEATQGVMAALEALADVDGSFALAVASHAMALTRLGSLETSRVEPYLTTQWLTWCGRELSAQRDGEHWRLCGSPAAVVMGGRAEAVVVDARGQLDEPLRFLVPVSSLDPSMNEAHAWAMRASAMRWCTFEPFTVDDACRVERRGTMGVDAGLCLAAIAVGLGRASLREAIDYAQQRVQFGRSISEFQAIQFKIADAITTLDAAALLVASATPPLDDAEDRAARIRGFATRNAVIACSEALQIHGGYGYTLDLPLERRLRDARWCAQGWAHGG